MSYPILAICDNDLGYIEGLYEQLVYKNNINFTIRLFTNANLIKECQEDIAILLMGEDIHNHEYMKIPINAYITLGERQKSEQENYICKYSKSCDIAKKIIDIYNKNGNYESKLGKYDTKVVTLYSPVKRTYQTTFAITLGQILSEKFEVLYINLETNSGFKYSQMKEYNLTFSDLFYQMKITPHKFLGNLDIIVEKINKLNFIPPFQNDIDLRGINSDDICKIIEELAKIKKYDYIIVDLSDGVEDVYKVLDISTHIFVPTLLDEVSLAKLEIFYRSSEKVLSGIITDRITKISIPTYSNIPVEFSKLPYSEMGIYVRQVLSEQGDLQDY